MNVGISSSFNSEGGGGADRRAGCSAGLTYPAGGTGVGRMPRSRNGSTPGAAREAVSAPAAGLSNPVAITVTRISPCMAGSFTVPKMISASSPAASFTTSEIWVTSPSVRSSPPVMLMSTPVAPVIEMLSSSGDEIACCTASVARFSPRPMPVPMIAAPPFCITVRTSAKSTFTMPVTVMREEIPCVAWSSTSSAFLSASWNGMPLPTTASRRSFGTTTMVSTCFFISAIPISAWRIRFRPSNRNGFVTMPMVRAPRSRAICAMLGDAPVPVPPPMPQVTNTRSAPWRECSTSSRFSSIAWRPISGRAPAPSPRVSFFPIWTLTSALLLRRAWASVLTEMNSTPGRPSSTMRLSAVPPPPPTPTTFIRAFCDPVSSSSKIMAPSGPRSEEVLQPSLERSEQPVHPGALRPRAPPHPAPSPAPTGSGSLRHPPRRVQHQPCRHRVARRLYAVHQPGDPVLGRASAHRHAEHVACELHHPRQVRRAPRQHHPGGEPAAPIARLLELAVHHMEDLFQALVDDLRQHLARRLPCPLARRGGQRDHLRRIDERLVRDAVPLLEPLGVGLRHAEHLDHVGRQVRPGEPQRREVPDLPLVEDGDPGRAAADLDQRHAQLPLVVRQYRVRRGQGLEHQVRRAVSRPLHALAQVLGGRGLHRHEVHLDLEPRPRHPHGVRDAALLVDHVLLRNVVQELVVFAERDRAGDLVHPGDVRRGDFVAAHRDHAGRRSRRDVLPRDAARQRGNFGACHPLGVPHRGGHGARGLVDVAHHAAAHAAVLRQPHAQHLRDRLPRQIAHDLSDHGARLGAPQVEAGHEPAVPRHGLPRPPRAPRARRPFRSPSPPRRPASDACAWRRTTTCPA